MKKISILLVCLLAMSFAFISCDDKDDSGGGGGVTYSGAIGDATLQEVNTLRNSQGLSQFSSIDDAVTGINSWDYTLSDVNTVISAFTGSDERFNGVTEAQARARLESEGVPSGTIDALISTCNSKGFVVGADERNGKIGIVAAKKD